MKKQPNIVFIISDDQGYWSLGCSGNEEIISPNIDRLAQEGMRFENFFCTSPVCSPARASLLTGTIPSQHGVHDWLRDDDEKTVCPGVSGRTVFLYQSTGRKWILLRSVRKMAYGSSRKGTAGIYPLVQS